VTISGDEVELPASVQQTPSSDFHRATLEYLLAAAGRDSDVEVVVIETQIRPHQAREVVGHANVARSAIVLVDCGYAARHERLLGPRAQPELVNEDMDRWAAYLRGQADALGLPIIDTAVLSIDVAVSRVIGIVDELRPLRT
jgi:hypothetical protein